MRNFWRQNNTDNNNNNDISLTVINENAHNQGEELNEEDARARAWEEKEDERIRNGLWPSSEWSVDDEELGAFSLITVKEISTISRLVTTFATR